MVNGLKIVKNQLLFVGIKKQIAKSMHLFTWKKEDIRTIGHKVVVQNLVHGQRQFKQYLNIT